MAANRKTQTCAIAGNSNSHVNDISQSDVVVILGHMQQGSIFQVDNARPEFCRVLRDLNKIDNPETRMAC